MEKLKNIFSLFFRAFIRKEKSKFSLECSTAQNKNVREAGRKYLLVKKSAMSMSKQKHIDHLLVKNKKKTKLPHSVSFSLFFFIVLLSLKKYESADESLVLQVIIPVMFKKIKLVQGSMIQSNFVIKY